MKTVQMPYIGRQRLFIAEREQVGIYVRQISSERIAENVLVY